MKELMPHFALAMNQGRCRVEVHESGVRSMTLAAGGRIWELNFWSPPNTWSAYGQILDVSLDDDWVTISGATGPVPRGGDLPMRILRSNRSLLVAKGWLHDSGRVVQLVQWPRGELHFAVDDVRPSNTGSKLSALPYFCRCTGVAAGGASCPSTASEVNSIGAAVSCTATFAPSFRAYA